MVIIGSMLAAFSMYSRIPVPGFRWDDRYRRYMFCFFPCIGIIIGALLALWFWIVTLLSLGQVLFAAGGAILPVLVTGGIHMDGFCDVMDAKSSYAPVEKRLEILKDPHIGAFALIWCTVYFLAVFGFLSAADQWVMVLGIGMSYPMSRSLCSISALCFPQARSQGMLADVVHATRKKAALVTALVMIALCLAVTAVAAPVLLCGYLPAAAGVLAGYRRFSTRQFGGITGDTAGWLVQVSELLFLAVTVVGTKLMEVLI